MVMRRATGANNLGSVGHASGDTVALLARPAPDGKGVTLGQCVWPGNCLPESPPVYAVGGGCAVFAIVRGRSRWFADLHTSRAGPRVNRKPVPGEPVGAAHWGYTLALPTRLRRPAFRTRAL